MICAIIVCAQLRLGFIGPRMLRPINGLLSAFAIQVLSLCAAIFGAAIAVSYRIVGRARHRLNVSFWMTLLRVSLGYFVAERNSISHCKSSPHGFMNAQ